MSEINRELIEKSPWTQFFVVVLVGTGLGYIITIFLSIPIVILFGFDYVVIIYEKLSGYRVNNIRSLGIYIWSFSEALYLIIISMLHSMLFKYIRNTFFYSIICIFKKNIR
jgi:hypothetical protein